MATLEISDEMMDKLRRHAEDRNLSIEDLLQAHVASLDTAQDHIATFLENTLTGIYMLQGERLIYVNRGLSELFGYTVEEITRDLTLSDLLHPDSLPIARSRIQARFGGTLTEGGFQTKGIKKNGNIVHLWVDGILVQYQGQPTIMGLVLDISKQEALAESLTHSEARYQLLTEQSLIGIYVAQDGIFVYANPSFAKIFGYRVDDIVNQISGEELLHPSELPTLRQRIAEHYAGAYPQPVHRYRGLKKDGSEIYFEVHSQLTEYHGRPAIMGTLKDVTKEVLTEQQLRASEARYRAVAQNFPHGLLAMYDHDLVYTLANGQGLAEIGMTPADLEGKRLRDVFSPEIYARDEPALLAALNGQMTTTVVAMGPEHFRVTTLPVRDDKGEIIAGMVMSQNITDLVTAQHDLTEALDKLNLVLTASQLGVWYTNLQTQTVLWDDQAQDMFGLIDQPATTPLTQWTATVHPDDRQHAETVIQQIIQAETIHDLRYRIVHPTRGIRHIATSARAVYDDKGDAIALTGAARDITEEVEAQQALAHSEARYRALFDGSANPIVVYDEDGRFVMLNLAAAENLGTTPQAGIGKSLADFIPEFHDVNVQRVRQVVSSGEMLHLEDEVVLPNGDVRWYQSIMQPVADDQGNLRLVQTISYDITQHKLNESLLRHRQSVLDEAERINQMGSYEWNLITNRAIWSAGMERLTGIKNEAGIPDTILPILHPEDVDILTNAMASVLKGDNIPSGIQYRIIKDGEERIIFAGGRLITDEEGKPISLLGYMQDVTEQRLAEALEAEHASLTLKLEQERETAALRSRLLNTISHEIRTPLAVIMTSSEMLSKYHDRMSQDKRDQRLANIAQQVATLERMLDEVTTLLQADQGFLSYVPHLCDVKALVKSVVDGVSQAHEDSDHDIQVRWQLQSSQMLLDENLMHRALTNVLINAVKYSPEGGMVRLDVVQTPHDLTFSVSDEGIGVPADEIERLFEPFHRASNTTKIRGSGLGLAIVKEIADYHGGTVSFESTLGQGSVVSISLPQSAKEPL